VKITNRISLLTCRQDRPRTPRSPSARRASSALLGTLALAILVGSAGIVWPRDDHATLVVSRFGSEARLLPNRIAFSFWPLAERIRLQRRDGLVLVEARVPFPQPDGSTVGGEVEIRVSGDGALPVSAASIRDHGLEDALGRWLRKTIRPPLEARHFNGDTDLWRTIFPDDAALAIPDLQPILDELLTELVAHEVVLRPTANPEGIRAVARSELRRRTTARGRVILLGLDALDWRLVDELIRNGLMPTMSELVATGAHAVLDVPSPLISPVVWTTIATGATPDVHGVLDFLEPDPETGQARPVGSGSRKVAALWEMTAAAERTTSVIGWWATFPAQAPATTYAQLRKLKSGLSEIRTQASGVSAMGTSS